MQLQLDYTPNVRETFTPRELAFEALLNKLDVIGVFFIPEGLEDEGDFHETLVDEYDDLVRPLLRVLDGGADVEIFESILSDVLEREYGIEEVFELHQNAATICDWHENWQEEE